MFEGKDGPSEDNVNFKVDAETEEIPQEEWEPGDLESSLEFLDDIISAVLENYTAEELRNKPIKTEDFLLMLLESGVEAPSSWSECSEEIKAIIRKQMENSAASLPGAKVEDSNEGPIITA